MYFMGLPEREKMAYSTRVKALQCRFGQETDTSITLQELAGVRRGKNQLAKELQYSARRLASRAYHSNDYASQEKAALHAFQTAVAEDLQLKCTERGCPTLEVAVATVEVQERYTKRAVWAVKQKESDMASYLMGEKLEALLGEIKDDRKQWKQWDAGSRNASGMPTGSVTLAIRMVTSHVSARPPPPPKEVWETDSCCHRSRCGAQTGRGDRRNMCGGERIIPAGTDCW